MLTTLDQAKQFLLTKVPEYMGTELEPGEPELLETLLETDFLEKIEGLISAEDLEAQHLETEEEVEHYLFQHIPNYTTLLEESVADVISDYLDPEDNEQVTNNK